MLFETKKDSRDTELCVGDIIEYTCNVSGEKIRRLVVLSGKKYICVRIDKMEQTLEQASLNAIKKFYMYEPEFRIIKSKNLKIVEVV